MERSGAKVGEVYLSKAVRIRTEHFYGEYRAFTVHAFQGRKEKGADKYVDVLARWESLQEALLGWGDSPREAEDQLISLVTDAIQDAADELEKIDLLIDPAFYSPTLPSQKTTFEGTSMSTGRKHHILDLDPMFVGSDMFHKWFGVIRNPEGDILRRFKLGSR